MAAAAATLSKCSFLPTITCMKPNPKRKPVNPLLVPNSYQPISFSITNPRLRISHTEAILPKRSRRLFVVSGLVDGNSETYPEVESNDLNEESATIDIKLPRRSLLVQFTCNECGERSQRFINRLAYERGLVFVQYNLKLLIQAFYALSSKWMLHREMGVRGAVSSDAVVTVGAGAGEGTNDGEGAGGGIAGAGTSAGGGVAGAGAGTSLAGDGAGGGVAGAGGGVAGVGDTCGGGKEGGGVAGGGIGVAAGELCGGGTTGVVAGATLGDGGDIGVVAGGGVTALAGDCVGVVGVVVGGGVVVVGVDGDAAGVWASVIASGKLRQAKMRAQSTEAI
ncbi:hypothetical protein POTOM_038152 [Populus tomentosa]|uniref:DNL-type domain-containing protein n=1 Tax=Populus tomentosa TaxID=118781 RepID=A0A8X7YVE8_POPTO|nr:hypothetical protein POTOM_038152 [Populus tomentosa]